jgi:hypothetical protein
MVKEKKLKIKRIRTHMKTKWEIIIKGLNWKQTKLYKSYKNKIRNKNEGWN